MEPETVHLIAQMLRHQRAALTSLERWTRSTAFGREEALEIMAYGRRVLDAYERALTGVTVTDRAS
jgi:hypothetical protein